MSDKASLGSVQQESGEESFEQVPRYGIPSWMKYAGRAMNKGDLKYYMFKDTSEFDYDTGVSLPPIEEEPVKSEYKPGDWVVRANIRTADDHAPGIKATLLAPSSPLASMWVVIREDGKEEQWAANAFSKFVPINQRLQRINTLDYEGLRDILREFKAIPRDNDEVEAGVEDGPVMSVPTGSGLVDAYEGDWLLQDADDVAVLTRRAISIPSNPDQTETVCPNCNGSGEGRPYEPREGVSIEVTCDRCEGTGRVSDLVPEGEETYYCFHSDSKLKMSREGNYCGDCHDRSKRRAESLHSNTSEGEERARKLIERQRERLEGEEWKPAIGDRVVTSNPNGYSWCREGDEGVVGSSAIDDPYYRVLNERVGEEQTWHKGHMRPVLSVASQPVKTLREKLRSAVFAFVPYTAFESTSEVEELVDALARTSRDHYDSKREEIIELFASVGAAHKEDELISILFGTQS